MKTPLAVALGLFLTSCATSGLEPLLFEGPELHPSLATRQLDDKPLRHVPRDVIGGNPYVATNADFVEVIARGGSQGQLSSEGVRAALYALYDEQNELGFYGLEAETAADADRLEIAITDIWAFRAREHQTRVHRGGNVLVVVWSDGVSPACWEAVNARVAERLQTP